MFSLFAGLAFAADPKRSFDIPADDAVVTLKHFTQQAGKEIVYPAESVRELRTNAIKGAVSSEGRA
ncbi:MAG: hypothetical protein QM736_06275 [Vicinamibacterales bacterium]